MTIYSREYGIEECDDMRDITENCCALTAVLSDHWFEDAYIRDEFDGPPPITMDCVVCLVCPDCGQLDKGGYHKNHCRYTSISLC